MTSKLTSRIACTHNSNKGDFEFGGVSVKGGYGKLRWNTVRQGDIWINGLFPEDDSFTRNCNSNPISLQTSPDCYFSEHSEVDWISKEIAYQDLICNERTNYCPDGGSGKFELIKEEHDMDIVSTLATIAALLRDWCVLEAELSQPVVDEPIERYNSLGNFYHDSWVWINDDKGEKSKVKKDVSMQGDVLKGSHSNVAWDDFIQERLRSQQMMCHAYFQSGAASSEVDCSDHLEDSFDSQKYVDIGGCPEEKAKQEFYSVEHFMQPFGKPVEVCNVWIDNQCLEADSVINKKELSIAAHPFVEAGFPDQFAHHHASQHPTASSRSFGCEGGPLFRPKVGEIFPVGPTSSAQMKIDPFHGEGLILAESSGGNKVGDGPGKVLPVHILDEKKCTSGTIQELGFVDGVSSSLDLQNEPKNDKNENELVNEAMPFVLPYMCLQGLLAMEEVCKSFRNWIENDLLLWQQLHVEPPLSRNFTDDVLLELASRGKGQLRCLNLVDCTKVTEAAVEQVVSTNLKMTKLSIPGCSRISAESVIRMVEVLTHQGHPGVSGLKQLRVRNIYGLTREHLAKLENMVGVRSSYKKKPQYYHNGHNASFCDDERPIDVEECPKCTNVRLVYDCTREKCQQKQGSSYQDCRACFLCTVRCEECGRCIDDNDFEETFSLDLLCSCCWLRLPKCASCSRPGCGRHADHFIRTPERTFFCGDCSGTSVDTRGPEFHFNS